MNMNQRVINDAINSVLDVKERQVMLYKYIDNKYSDAQIASILGISITEVQKIEERAKKKIGKYWSLNNQEY